MNNNLKSLIISFFITASLCIINILTALGFGYMIPSIPFSGGEITTWIGFGMVQEKIYLLTAMNDPNSSSVQLSFNIIIFLVSLLIVFIIVVISRKYKKPGFLYKTAK